MEYGNAKLAKMRERFPMYRDVPDDRFAAAIAKKFYPNQPRERVFRALGLPDLQSATPAPVLPAPPPLPTQPSSRLASVRPPPVERTLMHDEYVDGRETLARAPSEAQARTTATDQRAEMRERLGNLFDRLGQTSFAQSDLMQTLGRGVQKARQGGSLAAADAGLISPETAGRQYAAGARALEQLRPASPAVQRGLQEITGAEGPWDAVAAAIRNPEAMLSTAIESLPYSAPSAALAIGGAVAGPAGVAAGAGTGSFIAEYGASFAEALRDRGVDPGAPGALERAFADPELIAAARGKALRRGVTIGAFDALTGGMAGKLLRSATGPVSAGVRGTGELGIQAGGGGAGEAAAGLVDEGRVNWGDVVLEAGAEIPGGAPEIAGGVLARQPAPPAFPTTDPRVATAQAQAAAIAQLDPTRQRPSVLQQVQTVAPPMAQPGPQATIVQPAPVTFQQLRPQAVQVPAQTVGEYAAPMREAQPDGGPAQKNMAQNITKNITEPVATPPKPLIPLKAEAELEAVQAAVKAGATPQQAVDAVRIRAIEQEKAAAGIGGFKEADVVQFLDETGTRTGRVAGFAQTPDGLQIRITTPDGETVLYEGPAAGEQFTQLDTAAMPPEQKRGVYLSAYPDGEVTQRRVQKLFAITPKAAGELMRKWGAIEKAEVAAIEAAKPTPQKVEEAAAVTAEPTPAQAEAGNYRKGRVEIQGLKIAIETPKGGTRTGLDREGKPWSAVSPAHYGYFERGGGADGDKLDVFVGDDPDAPDAYVIDQYDPETGRFDEHKAVIGVGSPEEALALYEASFSDGSGASRWASVTALSIRELKTWIAKGDHKKPLGPPTGPAIKSTGRIGRPPVRETPSPESDISTTSPEEVRDPPNPVAEAPAQPEPIQAFTTRGQFEEALRRDGQAAHDGATYKLVRRRVRDTETWTIDLRRNGQPPMTLGPGWPATWDRERAALRAGQDTQLPVAEAPTQPEPTPEPIRQPEPQQPEQPDMLGGRTIPEWKLAMGERARRYVAQARENGDDPIETLRQWYDQSKLMEEQARAGGNARRAELWRRDAAALRYARGLLEREGRPVKREIPQRETARDTRAEAAAEPEESGDGEEGQQGRQGDEGRRDQVPPVAPEENEPVTQSATPQEGDEPKPRVLARRIRHRLVLELQKQHPKRLVFGDLQNLAKEVYGGSMAEGAFSAADVYDAGEAAVNEIIAKSPAILGALERSDTNAAQYAINAIRRVQRLLPTQTRRADEKIAFQQFSTPPEYAFAVAWAGNPQGAREVALEPSAGTGSLVAMMAARSAEQAYANEIDPRRRALLQSPEFDLQEVFAEDAEQLDRILPDRIKPTLILMNPPFSAAGNRGVKRDLMTGARHIEQALERLQPGGRLVAIVGRGMSLDAATFRPWWAKMRQRYNVRANVSVSGDLYRPYGTDFATRVLVFDKDGPTSGSIVQGEASTPEDIIRLLEGVRNDRPSIVQRPAQPSRPERPEAAPGAGQRPEVPAAAGDAGGGPRAQADARPGARAGEGGERTGSGDREVPARPERGQAVAGVADEGQRRPAEPEPVRPPAAEPRGSADEGERPVQPAPERDAGQLPEPEPAAEQSADDGRVDESLAAQVSRPMDDAVFEEYDPQVKPLSGATKHPTPLVESAAMATVRFPVVDAKPNLPANVVEEGRLSSAQIETIALAESSHKKWLGDGQRRGFFIGDGTGVGKGAQIAGIILSHMRKGGAKKAVWISKNKKLLEDATRDWTWVGGDAADLKDLGKTKLGEKVKHDGKILFSSFDTLRGNAEFSPAATITQTKKKGVPARVQQLIDWIGDPDFDGVIAFDEAHKMGNAVTIKGDGRPARPPSQTALAGVHLQRAFPRARIVYASATGATEVSNLSYAERLGLWGPGTSFPSVSDFIAKIESGGMAAMELVARDLKQQGLYTARALSMSGVKYERLEHALTADQRELYDELAKAWQLVLKNVNKALDLTDGRKSRMAKQAAYAAFWSAQQRFFNQVMISMQMPTALRAIENDIKAGNAVVIQLTNTNEAQQERALAKADASEDEDQFLDLDLTPRDMLMEMIEKGFPTEQYEEAQDPETGTKHWRLVKDREGNPVHNREAVAAKQELLQKLASIRVPLGAMEMIIKEFGTGKVAEVTGRSRRIVWDGEKQTIENRPSSANSAEIKAFQDDQKSILIFSMAGGTGASYHADLKAKNQRLRRHYLVQAGWRADEAIQGFGRTHRTNQKAPPEYVLVTTDLDGQRRFMSTIARRLAQLGAITRGQRQAGGGVFSERDNLESKYAELAVTSLFRDATEGRLQGLTVNDLIEELGLAVRNEETGKASFSAEPSVPKFLNRLLSTTVERQAVIFGMFQSRMDQAIQAAAERGELDTGMQTIKAERAKAVREETIYTDSDTKAETRYVHVEAEIPRKRLRFKDIERRVEGFVVNKRSGQIWGYGQSRSSTDKHGGVSQVRTLIGPSTEQRAPAAEIDDREKFDKVSGDQAKGLWQEAFDKAPATRKADYHLITGAILPIFNRLPGRAEVFRVQLDDGRRLIGMNLKDDVLESTLEKFNVGTEAPKLTPAEAVGEVYEEGARLRLANGWTIYRARVAGENRIEVIGPDWRYERELGVAGVFWETKNYQKRYFIPTGAKAADAMAATVKGRDIIKVERQRAGSDESLEASASLLPQRNEARAVALTKRAREQSDEIIRRATNIAKEINPRVNVEMVERLFGSGPAIEASGGEPGGATQEIAGVALPDIDLIILSLNMDDEAVVATAAHEAWHTIERLLDPKELDILRRAFPASGTVTQSETIAYAFGDWMMDRDASRGTPETRRIFAKIRRFLQRLGNMLHGLGFNSADDIFEAAARGEMAARDVLDEAFGPSFEGDTLQIGPSFGEPKAALPPATRASTSSALQQARQAGAPIAIKTTLRDRIYRLVDVDFDMEMTRVVQATFDRYHAIEKLERKVSGTGTRFGAGHDLGAFAAAHFASNPQSFMEVALHHATLTYDAQAGVVRPKKGSKGLLEVLAPLDTVEKMEAFERYAWARRARELKKQGREPADQKVIDANYAVAKDFPEIVAVFDAWIRFNHDILQFARQAGLIDDKLLQTLMSDAHYVPFFRAEVDANGKLVETARQAAKRSIEGQRSGIVRLKGSDRPVEIIENMVRNTSRLVSASYKNIAMQRSTRLMTRGNSATGETIISKAPRDWAGVQVPVAMLEKMLAKAGVTSVDFSGLTPTDKRSMARVFGMVAPTFRHQNGAMVVSVMVNGKPQYYRVHDELLFQSLHALTPAEMEGLAKLLFNVAKLPARLLRWGVTHDPSFALANFGRDTLSTWIVSGANPLHIARAVKQAAREASLASVYGDETRDPRVVNALAAGAGIGGWWDYSPETVRKTMMRRRRIGDKARDWRGRADLALALPRAAWERYNGILRASEQANRIALLEQLKREGESDAEAAFQAMNLLNFGARGSSRLVQIIVELTPFLNARLQGLRRLGQAAVGKEPVARRTRLGFWVNSTLMLGATAAIYALNFGDDEYDDLEEWEKDGYYHIRMSRWIEEQTGVRWFRFPKPFELGLVFSTIPSRIFDHILKEDARTEEMKGAIARGLFGTLAVEPTAAGTLALEQWANYDLYFGRSIVMQPDLPAGWQYEPWTPDTYRVLGQSLGVSPQRLEHLWESTMGTMGTYGVMLADTYVSDRPQEAKRWFERPVFKRFFRGDTRRSKWQERYYEAKADFDAAMAAVRKAKREGIGIEDVPGLAGRKRFFQITNKQLGIVKKQIEAARTDKSLDPEQRRQKLDELYGTRDQIYRQVRTVETLPDLEVKRRPAP